MANNTNGRPVAEIRVGRIIAAIWQNTPTDEGVFYSVHITRLFRRGLNWDRTPAFGRDDLLTVAKVADLANTRIYELQNAIEVPQPAGRRRRPPNARNAAAGPLPAAAFSLHAMTAVSIRLPDDVSQRLRQLAARTGRSRTFYILAAIREHLDNLEDVYLAEQRLVDLRLGKSHTVPLEDVMARDGKDD